MMNQQHQQHVQELAYYLWLSEGKPEGQEARHWQMASKLAYEEEADIRKRSIDPAEAKGATEPAQPDQT